MSMRIPSREEVEKIRKRYAGQWVRLIRMDDSQAPPVGAVGRVEEVDDMGQLCVAWDNGSHLSLILGEDDFEIV